jgi:hypothetical protein
MLSPMTSPGAYDTLELGGMTVPGQPIVSGFPIVVEWDVKAGAGVDGGTTTLKGRKPAEGTVKVQFFEPWHFDTWDWIDKALRSTMGEAPTVQGLPIEHPTTRRAGVSAVVCKRLGPVVHQGGQLYTIEFDLLEFRPPRDKGTKTATRRAGTAPPKTGATGDAASGAGPAPTSTDSPAPGEAFGPPAPQPPPTANQLKAARVAKLIEQVAAP